MIFKRIEIFVIFECARLLYWQNKRNLLKYKVYRTQSNDCKASIDDNRFRRRDVRLLANENDIDRSHFEF